MKSPGTSALKEKSDEAPGAADDAALPPMGPVTAWKSTEWFIMLEASLWKWTTTVSFTRTRKKGPGTLPLYVQYM